MIRGDKTTCGGVITQGCEDHRLFGQAIAREGDKVTCGQHPGMYSIVGGIANDNVHGRKMAGTRDSKSSCPCQARFIASMVDDTYEQAGGNGRDSKKYLQSAKEGMVFDFDSHMNSDDENKHDNKNKQYGRKIIF
ncbi:PAAR domain-containing protein [Citrobacter portucalensis]|uniref:PAAR domain-containing protein n=1 Tax=Citrobacter portucalensis TaxID=1639133 RepID=UPI00288C005A|nr:PAAR domain-containing protein [Citrobacter portucalensis]WNI83997.1 PAAR domain-containing protein [Citrobacter portucalensis]